MDGMRDLKRTEPFPDELFYQIFEIEDNVERQQYIEAMRRTAMDLKRSAEFKNLLKQYQLDYAQRMRETRNRTRFTDQPLELSCGEWKADDMGIRIQNFDRNMQPVCSYACSHPVLPTKILKNVDTQEERITLAYFKSGTWQQITADRSVCANTNKIVDALSRYGIEVTSDNAKNLVRYISDCVAMNPATLDPKKSINRLGWADGEFMPYADDIIYDGDPAYSSLFASVCEKGSFEGWVRYCGELRKKKTVRLAFGASFGSALIEPLNLLSFVFHLWGGQSGSGKTVAVMAAMSIWGNPKIGALVKTLDGTKVGIIRNAAFLYSLPFAGDELQTLMKEYQGNFDQLIYRITEGIDRMRGRASGGVEETKTWRNSFLFSGEEPITKSNSRAGSKNRVIEIEAVGKLIDKGNETVTFLTENYGHAGRRLVEYLMAVDKSRLTESYQRNFAALCQLDTTEKQAMAMACILTADEILVEQIFTGEEPLTIDDVKEYMKTESEVDVAERAYWTVLNWIARNPVRFSDPKADDSLNRGEVWGRIVVDEAHPSDPPCAIVNKDVMCRFLENEGYDYAALCRAWAEKERIRKNSQGKYVHQTKVYGIKASYIKINMLPDADADGFVNLEEEGEQMTLPFD